VTAPSIATAPGEIAHHLNEPLCVAKNVEPSRKIEPIGIVVTPRAFGDSPIDAKLRAVSTPKESLSLADSLAKLTSLLPDLADALGRQSKSQPPVARMTLRIDEVADAVGVSRRVLERERAAGRMPKSDLRIGKMPLWRVETIHAWINSGGKGVA
jgi:predicted DNA-binding transcriptional regulator AlpA